MKKNSIWKTFFTVCAVIVGAIGFIALMGAVANSGNSTPSSPIQPIQPSLDQQQPVQQTINNNSDTPPVATPDINTPAVVAPPAPTPVAAGPDWSSYQSVGFEEYRNDPQAYFGTQIVVDGAFTNNFFPSSGSGNGTNFMAIEDYSEGEVVGQPGGFPNIEVQINNNHDYALTVQALSDAERTLPLRIYGTGTQSMNIEMTNGSTLIIPAINATRIDQCMNEVYSASSNNMVCDEWAAIFPTNIEPTFIVNGQPTSSDPMSDPGYVPTTPAPGGTSAPASTPSNPRYFQLNVAGACENDGNGAVILTGYPYANGYSIPSDDITEWSDGAIGFTVPSDMATGTYQVDIRGYTPGVGTCPDVNGGSITVQ